MENVIKFSFQMTFRDKVVAQGEASAVMTSEFQRAFKEGIGPIQQLDGTIPDLNRLLDMRGGELIHWRAMGIDDSWHGLTIIRSHEQ